jgi:hypothetical protein
LTGIEQSLYRPKANKDQMRSMYSARSGKMGDKYIQLGKRGKQHVQKINRVLVGKGALNQFKKRLEGKAGRLKASFCLGWAMLQQKTGKGKKPAAWIMKHVDNHTAKGSVISGLGIKGAPSFTIISNQSGCTKPQVLQIIRAAIISRIQKIQSDFENGYIFERLNRKP